MFDMNRYPRLKRLMQTQGFSFEEACAWTEEAWKKFEEKNNVRK